MRIAISRDGDFYKRLSRLTGFIALQNVIVCFVGLADNVMIGAYSQDALGGVALANQLQFFLQMLAGGIAEGMAVIAAQYWGTKRTEPVKRVTTIALGFAIAAGLIFTAFGRLCPEGVLGLLTTDPAAIREGADYIRIVCFSYIPFCVTCVLITAQRSVENVTVGMLASLGGLGVNIALNYILIFGNLGAPRMGVRGAAIATLIGRLAEMSVALCYTAFKDKRLRYRLSDLLKLDKVLLRDYARVGTPVFLASASWGVAMTVQTAILGHMEAANSVIAANSIANTLFQLITVVVYGLASASGVVIGKAVGAGDNTRLKEYVDTLQIVFIAAGLATGAILFCLKGLILSMYSVTPEAYRMGDQFINVLCVTVVGTAYQCACLTGIVRGGGNTKFVFYNDLVFMWGLVLPASLLAAFVFHWQPVWVFVCLKADQVLKCAVAAWEVNSYHWVRKIARNER